MPDDNRRFESMLFNYETSSRTDYQPPEFVVYPETVHKEKPTCAMMRPLPLKNLHSLVDWKNPVVPFNLYHKPKEIVRTNPRDVQKPYTSPIDHQISEVQKSRPRLIMTPAVSMDDIEDPRAREILCNDMYTSTMSKKLKEAVSPYLRVCAPLPNSPAPAKPVVLAKLQPPYVSPVWRMESVSWDNRQLRAFCDPTKEFWSSHPLNPCQACEESKMIKAHREVIRQHKTGRP